ncbi:hypothetical protein J0A67_14715 [Algoriphagus aestuariicola]|uniref:YtxH domain-containing protein n=1 Tax=Algoriphagus aestuariicola TaxID=1852016 RepID=A0ABS3BS46_9BACT|nr:hypothetical protein [Algoriphagus aestuariicola]MBN7802123.1 hypothetical protein [Algoriphagus aestuariicola]
MDKTPEELEQTLAKQLELLKKESEDLLKVGAVVAVGALLTYGIVKATRKKKVKPTDKAMEVLEREGLLNEDIKKRLSKSKGATFWPSFTQRLVILGLALAKDKLFHQIFSSPAEVKSSEKGK